MALSKRLLLPFLGLGLMGLLSGCLLTEHARNLNFQPNALLNTTDPTTVLLTGQVAAAQLTSIPEALRRAPRGSLIVACWQDTEVENFWGPCSHITRKLTGTTLADTWPSRGAGEYPISMLYKRYAVIVLDQNLTDAQLGYLQRELKRIHGSPYNLSGRDETYYCSNLQNRLSRAVDRPEAVPLNPVWKAYIPADALLQPGTRVLWVGVQGYSGPNG